MELAARFGAAQPGGLIVAAISAVFTIGYVANQLGEDADWLFDLSVDMFPEDGCLWVYGDRVRHRMPTPNHRRRTSCRQSVAPGPTAKVAYLRCSPHADAGGRARGA